jgi:hypothetical protein
MNDGGIEMRSSLLISGRPSAIVEEEGTPSPALSSSSNTNNRLSPSSSLTAEDGRGLMERIHDRACVKMQG